jgi:hypothetical protein
MGGPHGGGGPHGTPLRLGTRSRHGRRAPRGAPLHGGRQRQIRARCRRTVLAYWKFQSISLQRRESTNFRFRSRFPPCNGLYSIIPNATPGLATSALELLGAIVGAWALRAASGQQVSFDGIQDAKASGIRSARMFPLPWVSPPSRFRLLAAFNLGA